MWCIQEIFRGTRQRFPPKYIENTFWIKSTFRSLEIHSKRSYKICIRSVILGGLECFRDYKSFSFVLPKILDVIQRITKERILLITLFITFLNPKF